MNTRTLPRRTGRPDAESVAWLTGADDADAPTFFDTPLRRRDRHRAHPAALAATLTQLAALTRAGTPADQGLAAVAAMHPSGRVSNALATAAEQVRRGRSVPAVLADTRMLDAAVMGRVAVAEITGDLPAALDAAAGELRHTWLTRRTLRWAIGAPAVTALTLLAVCAVLFTVVTPALVAGTATNALPATAQVLLWAGRTLPVLAVGGVLTFVVWRAAARRRGRRAVAVRSALAGLLPGARRATALAEEATWASVAAALLTAGLDVPSVARAAADVTDSAHRTTRWTAAATSAGEPHVLASYLPATASPALRGVTVAGQRGGALADLLTGHAQTARTDLDDHARAAGALALPVGAFGTAALIAVFCLGVLVPTVALLH